MTLSKNDLIQVFAQGIKKPEDRGIGIERECFLYTAKDHRRLDYEGIRSVLDGFVPFGWEGVFEKDAIIGGKRAGASISLEPGGQFELSGAVHKTLHNAHDELHVFQAELSEILAQHSFKSLCLGFEPFWRQEDLPWMPKGRYKIMRDYMTKVGKHGHDMMRRTSTLQINLDYTSEENMVQMMQLTQLLHPLIAALFAASPFYEGKLSAYKSFRNYVWQDTDKDRCGLLDFVFDEDFGFERYVEYLLGVPMYFVYREGYEDVSGLSFRDFMAGKLKGFEGQTPTLSDFMDQMSITFPEVRLKTFIEIRGIDASPIAFSSAAFWVGLLYDNEALDRAYALTEPLRENLYKDYVTLPKDGLQASTQWGLLEDFFALARRGLERRGLEEQVYLLPAESMIENRRTYAQNLISKFEKEPDLYKILL